MTVIVNFNVRNPEWYWPADKLKESTATDYEKWKEMNEGAVPKHIPTWAYKVGFDVKEFKENRSAEYELKYSLSGAPDSIRSTIVKDMTHVIFSGPENEKLEVVISNKIMHSFLGAKQSGRTYYWYFYIHADAEYERVNEMIWLSKEQSLTLS